MKHVGVHSHRLKPSAGNPVEVLFAKEWEAQNTLSHTLDYLIQHVEDRSKMRNATEQEVICAASVIQWLGSPVGLSFLRSVAEKSPEMRRYIL